MGERSGLKLSREMGQPSISASPRAKHPPRFRTIFCQQPDKTETPITPILDIIYPYSAAQMVAVHHTRSDGMNFAMWRKALNVIPDVSKSEWDQLDVISKWLISTRAAVLVMTFISAALAGLFAWRDNSFSFLPWIALTLGLILAHASNNIFNDYTDFMRGVDKDNYYRNIYGAQPIASGLMTQRQHLTYFAVTALIALVFGLYLAWYTNFSGTTWVLLALGAFFLLFYT